MKSKLKNTVSVPLPSLPSRERGLKSPRHLLRSLKKLSLPSRERGLKFKVNKKLLTNVTVAPFAGAWIEILSPTLKGDGSDVAPFAGAWIEITSDTINRQLSPVAPFAGAWIEIS